MEKILSVAQVIVPIFAAIGLGFLAKRKSMLTPGEIRGFQQFVMKIGLPCVVFNSCLTADIGAQSLTSMGLALAAVLMGCFWAFWARKKQFAYHNIPIMFAAQETGMLGIPLFMVLFGAQEAYRMGVLDLAQAVTAYPVIAILSANTGENLKPLDIAGKVLTSPLTIMCFLGLGLNLSGLGSWLDSIGVRAVITESTGFLSQPVSAMMIFSVGYNFSLDKGNRRTIFQLSAMHIVYFALFGLAVQGILLLIPNADALTRWALMLYFLLPASYLAPTLGRSQQDFTVASGVCSLTTVTALAAFCVIAVLVS